MILSCNKNKHQSLDEFEFFEMRFDLGTLDSGERLLPFGLLVNKILMLLIFSGKMVTSLGNNFSLQKSLLKNIFGRKIFI